MYELHFASSFSSSYKALIKGDRKLEKRVEKSLKILRNSPFYPSLKSHKVNTRSFGKKWSSWITGDIRIIWDFDSETKQIIILLAVTQHSGSHREYK